MGSLAYNHESVIGASLADVSRWHFSLAALGRTIPPWINGKVVAAQPIADGSRTSLELAMGPLKCRWVAVHRDVLPSSGFTDEMEQGPFSKWTHRHEFEALDYRTTRLRDLVEFELPFQWATDPLASWVYSQLERVFRYRHSRVARDLRRHAIGQGSVPLSIAVTGASGLIGSALCAVFECAGHRVLKLVRGVPSGPQEVQWNPAGVWDASQLEGVDAVVHLAGVSIANGRWTPARMQAILDSRVVGTRSLSIAMAKLRTPPRVLITASGCGYYGNSADRKFVESDPSGAGFLAQVAREWEGASLPAIQAGIRTAHMRLGVVVSARGGAVGAMKLPFLFGAGGPIGDGRQGMPWIHIDDVLAGVAWLISHHSISGGVNFVAPEQTTQREFAQTMGTVLHRPAFLPFPKFAVGALLGQMGEDLLLGGQFLEPMKLRESGFQYDFPTLKSALDFEFGRAG